MDQSKSALDLLKKHMFWILISVVLIAGLVVGMLAIRSVEAAYAQRVGDLEALQSSMSTLQADNLHPNDGTLADLDVVLEDTDTVVTAAWHTVFDDQYTRNEWPYVGDEFNAMITEPDRRRDTPIRREYRTAYLEFVDNHYPEMLEKVERRKPQTQVLDPETGEAKLDDDTGEPIWVDAYDYEALKASGAATAGSGSSMGGYGEDGGEDGGYGGGGYGGGDYGGGDYGGGDYGGGDYGGGDYGGGGEYGGYGEGGYGEDGYGEGGYGEGGYGEGGMGTGASPLKRRMVGKVLWNTPEIFRITAGWVDSPSAERIWLAQEDMWVYEALLSIISETNASSLGYADAAVKEIIQMNIGADAADALKVAQSPVFQGGLSGASGMGMDDEYEDYGDEDGYGYEGEDGMMAGGVDVAGLTTAEAAAKIAKHNRYVDAEGMPLGADDEPPYGEFNMMPIHLVLRMDQTKLPLLQVNCANSTMPIDIRHVRIGMDKQRASALQAVIQAAAAASMSGDEEDGYGGYESEDGYGYGGLSGMEDGSESSEYGMEGGAMGGRGELPQVNDDILVELVGVIYVFTRPEESILAAEQAAAEADAAADESTDATDE